MDDLISRKAAIEACIEISKQEEEYSRMWAAGLRYAKRILTKLPSVPAVPLDKLCEWLANSFSDPPCCMLENVRCEMECGFTKMSECWWNVLTEWMEGLDAAESMVQKT